MFQRQMFPALYLEALIFKHTYELFHVFRFLVKNLIYSDSDNLPVRRLCFIPKPFVVR